MNKKTVVLHSNFSRLFTGFGRTSRTLLRYLFKTGKYRLIEAANGIPFDSEETKKQPWTCHGTLPSPEQQNQINSNPDHAQRDAQARMAGYGYFGIDKIVEKYKPDIWVGAEDVWAVSEFEKKPWFDKLTPILWTTLDSLNLLPSSIDLAPVYKNYFVWASFAEEEFKRLGYSHIKTLHGCIDPTPFYNIGVERKKELRKKFNILNDTIIIGLISRNQLRKGFPHLIFALKELRERNPNKDIKLLFNTSFKEGFDIPKLAEGSGVSLEHIYTTYFCRHCKEYEVRPFSGHEQDCKFCGSKGTVNTVDICHAVSDEQLNQVYNLFDIACLPLTSGGLEYFCLESKLCEIPLLVTDYSAGTDAVKEGTGGFALDWIPDVEPATNFIKARTKVSSIVEKVEWLISLPKEEKEKIGKQGRQYILDNYSIDVIGKKWEDILDALPEANWEGELTPQPKIPSYVPPNGLSPEQFVISILQEMMLEKVDHNTFHVKSWSSHLRKSNDYQGVYNHFQKLALQFNANLNNKPIDLADLLDKDDEGRRICIVCDQSAGDILIVNSLLNQFKALYPEYNLYFFTRPEFFDLLDGHEAIYKLLPYSPVMDNIMFMEGNSAHKGYFVGAFYPAVSSQKFMSMHHNDLKHRAEWLIS